MSVQLNHTIVHATDREATATHLTEILGLPEAQVFGPFRIVELSNQVSLDVVEDQDFQPQHYAFKVSETEFDEIFGRIVEQGITYWADPFHRQEGQINHNDGGRGVYWEGPDRHNLEIITVPYGGG